MNGAWAEARRLLVMRLDNIGDVVMTSPVLRALKENLPAASITLMASLGGKEVAPLLPWPSSSRAGAGVEADRNPAGGPLRRGDYPHLF